MIDLRGQEGDPSSISNLSDFTTRHIEIDWTLDFDQRQVSGWVELTVQRLDPEVPELVFDASALDISQVRVRGLTGLAPLDYQYSPDGGRFGGRLSVRLPDASQEAVIRVDYATSAGCKALQWLTPEQTAGKEHPYVFSQCQAILARSLLPCQDTPAVKATYTATLRLPPPLFAVMSANEREDKRPDGSLLFRQTMPIPSYLIALAAGNLKGRVLTPVSSVWAEPELLEAAAYEFAQVGDCLGAAEAICGPYQWGRYDLLILPPSFPFGGMENPCLTFLTPSLLAGDRSLVNVIAHEIAHSWTGNLVTNRSWEHFWLNEGFTTFLERKIIGRMEGEAARQLHAFVGLGELSHDLEAFPMEHPGRQLLPDLRGTDPEDVFSVVPYEKGHTLLFTIEQMVGGPERMDEYLAAYIKAFGHGGPIDTATWYEHLCRHFADVDFSSLDLSAWFKGAGMPPVIPDYDRSLLLAVESFAAAWLASGGAPKSVEDDEYLRSFSPWQQMLFLNKIEESSAADEKVTPALLTALSEAYSLESSNNVEILMRWYKLALSHGHSPAYAGAARFATQHGRMKYCRPIYRLLFANEATKQLALDTFKEHRTFYHPVAAAMIAKDLGL